MEDKLELRVHGDAAKPTLVYLPGLHGDWTLVGSFRHALAGRVQFVEVSYPRTLKWSLNDYASAVLEALLDRGITAGWVLAESFSSQVAWSMLAQAKTFTVSGIILAGGFVQYPYRSLVYLARYLNRTIPMSGLRLFLKLYAAYAHFRHRHAPETLNEVHEFVSRRGYELDRQAICRRYDLILGSDFRRLVCQTAVPVYQIYGLIDPIVPAFPVRRWLGRHCKGHRESKLIWGADHNVLGTAPKEAADQITQWMAREAARNS